MEQKLAKFEDYIGDHFGQIMLRGLQALILVAVCVTIPVLAPFLLAWMVLLAIAKISK